MIPLLQCEGITYSYGTREVLKGVQLELHRGEILGCLGRNGSGKSTLMSLLIGNTPVQGGKIFFDGQRVHARSFKFRSQIGVVFQRPSLDGKLTARQNLVLAARLHGIVAEEAKERIEKSLLSAGLADRAEECVGTFSGGMRRRLDIARALIHEPALLFLDEPTAGLDEAAFRETWTSLLDLKRQSNTSVLLVTHRAEEAEHCDRLAILSEGKIIACESPDALRNYVKSDVVVVKASNAENAARQLSDELQLSAVVAQDEILVETEAGHLLIPRIVDSLGAKDVQAVSLRRASLGDVFLKLTGSTI